MALLAAKTDPDDVIRHVNLKADFFDAWSQNEYTLEARVEDATKEESALVQGLVGSTAYASISEPRHTRIRAGETRLVCAEVIEQIITDIAAAPTTVTHEYADLDALRDQVERFRERADVFLNPYIISEDEAGGKMLFSGGSTGVDETLRDSYPERDYGALEDNR